jgi:hypothetical protein
MSSSSAKFADSTSLKDRSGSADASGSSTLAARASVASKTSPKTKYLIAYNAVSTLLWLAILNRVVTTTVTEQRSDVLYKTTGDFARWTQTVALLEILHAALGE